jgi:tetratricopeptide (TPR) repeat protein
MYWPRQAITSARKAAESGKGFKRGPLRDIDPGEMRKLGSVLELFEGTFEFQEQAGETLRETFDALRSAAELADQKMDEFEPLGEIKRELKGAIDFFGQSAAKLFGQAIEEVLYPILGLPTRDLPEGLTASAYYDLAQRYKSMGWTEQARDACLQVREIDPDSEVADLAMRFLRTRIPRLPVPHAAVQKNIEGYNELARGDLEAAERTFKALTKDYSDFEWPYGNLGLLYIRKGEIDRAKEVLWKALDLNGNYVNAWVHLARARAICLELSDARTCIDKAMALDPDDHNAKSLNEVINFLSAL